MAVENGKAKYYILMEELKNAILSGKIKPGEKLPSENELSLKYSISRHTVRKALSILTNEGYIIAEHGKGTYCSERLKNHSASKNIAVVTTYISDYIFPRLIKGIDNVLTANGYSIILKNTGNSRKNEARCLDDIMTKNIDGLIIEPSKSDIYCKNINQYNNLDQLGIPYVFIQGTYQSLKDKPSILMDDMEGSYMLTKYLIELGHKSIVGIFKVDDSQGVLRHKGYVKALNEAGFPYDPDKVIWFHTEDRDIKPKESIKDIILSKVQIDGIVCYNDQIAYEVIRELQDMNKKVPEDISVTGYDDSMIASNGPIKLTTIAHPKEKLGEMAAELLLEKIHGIDDNESKVARLIEPQMIIRESCMKR
ncbi:GntR family transcriptional regulator [Anaeromicropila herbilytica]|uniref:Arabinose metabolism transcriptional repressor n=1 Tax=Anaeromicropila herbilytica TaxID=2785025 RepID=A0A7R7IC44_9FIRM|nr:GntR family transcriptional regulator [Anaeromicropila herbilytica]BCN30333.1 arabinose metabolism transcriptional repressor [Anaeromicropila herbilytica]